MPKGPTGQRRPSDVLGTAIKVAKIATGEVEDETIAGKEYAQKGGLKGWLFGHNDSHQVNDSLNARKSHSVQLGQGGIRKQRNCPYIVLKGPPMNFGGPFFIHSPVALSSSPPESSFSSSLTVSFDSSSPFDSLPWFIFSLCFFPRFTCG